MKFVIARPGTNPMEMPELIRRKRASKLQIALLVTAAVLVVSCLCGGSYYLYSNNRKAAAAVLIPSATSTFTPTSTATPSPTGTSTPTTALTSTITLQPFSTSAHTPTQMVISPVVVTRVVPGQDRIIERYYDRTVIVPHIITATPGPTQTPWIITITQIVEQTVIVEITSTPTPTPTPTEIVEIPTDPPAE